MHVKSAIHGLVVLFALLAATPGPAGQTAKQDTASTTLKITGMTCGGCATAVKLAAKKVSGVTDAKVSYETGEAIVTYDPAKTNPTAIAKFIAEKTGYKAEPVNSAPKASGTTAGDAADGTSQASR